MRHWLPIAVVLAPVLWMIGCSESLTPTPRQNPGTAVVQPNPSSPPAAPQSAPPAGATGGAASVQPATPAQPAVPATPAAPAAPATPEPPPPAAVGQSSIQLSAGVALPQTGPEGTLMSFSVDYEFVQGEPSPEGYVWVIERAHGNPARQSVKLSKQGNLPILIQGWRPEDGPFQTHLEDRKGNRLSESIELHVTGE